MKNNQPEFVLIYACKKCGLDSAFIEQENKITCPYCYTSSKMMLLRKEPISPELIADRIRLLTSRTQENLRLAFESMTEEEKNIVCDNGNEMEKEILLLLNQIKKGGCLIV